MILIMILIFMQDTLQRQRCYRGGGIVEGDIYKLVESRQKENRGLKAKTFVDRSLVNGR